jgi:hypothetical protein
MAKTTVNLKAIRAVLSSEITTMERTIEEGAKAVKNAKLTGKKRMIDANQKSLAHARKVLRKLKSVDSSLEDYCCDQKIQNCDFDF